MATEKVFTQLTNSGPISVYVRDGKIYRVRPLQVDKNDLKPWTIEANGKTYTPEKKLPISPCIFTERKKNYTTDRIKYPLKRVDFNPNGERNPQNRGKSGYVRISWDEALDLVGGEMNRIREQHGPEAIAALDQDHHNWGIVGYRFGPYFRFFNTIGFTEILHNPDSWEGWHWGAPHCYGFYWRLGMNEQFDLVEETLRHSEMIVHWGIDPDTIRAGYCGQSSAIWYQWLKEAGKEQIFIDPHCNYTAAVMGKWLPIRPGTDCALASAIAYTWIKQDTYDKWYIENRTIGFEKFKTHILGEDGSQEKTPKWAETITGIPARKIEALAEAWASCPTMVNGNGLGGVCRTAYGHEWTRLMILLQAMQGLGKPGVNLWGNGNGAPLNCDVDFPGYSDLNGMMSYTEAATTKVDNAVKQRLYRLLLPDAIMNPPITWKGEGFCCDSLEQQFTEFTYPMEGHSEVKLIYRYGGASLGTMTEGNRWIEMYQSPKLDMVVTQDCWWVSETGFADVVLPACTNLERNDIGEWGEAGGYLKYNANGANYRVIVHQKKAIEPYGDSRSDYWIFSELAKRLGVYDLFSDGGKTEEDWIRAYFDISDLPKYISWEEFEKKGYYVIPLQDDYKPTPSLRWFYEGRPVDTPDAMNPKRGTDKAHELGTYSGKIEFESQDLLQHTPDDDERPPVPRYIPSWEGHESELAKKYPLQMISPHPRYSFHTHYDKTGSWVHEVPGHRRIINGYAYQTVRINPKDAAARGIQNGDIIKLFNDRAAVLGWAMVTERMMPGSIHSYCSSAQYAPLEKGKAYTPDRGGCVNLLTPGRLMSKNAPGMAPNSCLVEIAKWEA